MRTGGLNSGRSRARAGMVAIIPKTRTRSSRYRSACSMDQVSAENRQMSSRSARARGVSRYRSSDDMTLAHPQLECRRVESLRWPALDALGDRGLQRGDRLFPLLIL